MRVTTCVIFRPGNTRSRNIIGPYAVWSSGIIDHVTYCDQLHIEMHHDGCSGSLYAMLYVVP